MANKKGSVAHFFFGAQDGGHSSNKRKSTHDKHTAAKRNSGSGRPNTKSSVRDRRNRNS